MIRSFLDLAPCVFLNEVNECKKLSYRACQVIETISEPLDSPHLQTDDHPTMQAEAHFALTTKEGRIMAD